MLTLALGCADETVGSPTGGNTSTSTSTGGSGGAGGDGETPTFTDEERAILASLSPESLPHAPIDITNRYADDAAAAELGRAFFFDPGFSGPLLTGDNNGEAGTLGVKGEAGKVACAGCHLGQTDFQDTRSPSQQISLGAAWGRRRAPSLLDIGQPKLLTWDGRRDTLHNQVFGPIESPAEMNSSRLFTAQQIFARYREAYEQVFGLMPELDDTIRFPPLSPDETGCQPSGAVVQPERCEGSFRGSPGDQGEYDGMAPADQEAVNRVVINFGKAIAAYERLLTCGPSRFDAWMHGDGALLTPSEQRGAKVFIGAGKCVDCHSGPFFSDHAFHNVGLRPGQVAAAFYDLDDRGAALGIAAALVDPLNSRGTFSDGDDGRLPAKLPPGSEGAFRTPMLRCVSRRPSFMHTAQLRTLESVIEFFDQGGHPSGYPGTSVIAPLGLDATQKADLAAFLRSLDGPGADPSLLTP